MVRCFYSLNDFRTPVMVSIAMMGLNLVLNLWFILGLELDADGLALGTATTSWLALALLWPLFRSRHRLPAGPPGLLRSLLTSAAGALACGLAAGLAYRGLCGPLASLLELLGLFDEVETRRRASQVLALLIAVGLGVAAHFGATLALASREAQAVLARLRRSGTR
jgi:peptidoglycan biosynthesis protein MviN/MurJ (putative lipid II flippase)